jgi:multiple antibiotic resistance protein
MSFQHYLLGIFAVANNFSAIGLFLSICEGLTQKERMRLAVIATTTSFITMMVALLAGDAVLEFFDIGIPAFRIAGGLLLLFSGMNMLNQGTQDEITHSPGTLSKLIPVAIVPIGIPLTTGAGTISTIIVFSGKLTHWANTIKLFAAIVAMTGIIFLIFRYSTNLLNFLGKVGMNVLIKVLGLITLAIGIQFIIKGLSVTFPAWVK